MGSQGVVLDWHQVKSELSVDEFVKRYAHPFLLRVALPGEADDGQPEGDYTERIVFDTSVVDPSLIPAGGSRAAAPGAPVIPVVKSARDPYRERVSVGRALNCDIVLREPSVSKLHAHFRITGPETAELTDAGSMNGTRINDRSLDSARPVPLRVGAIVTFGRVVVRFLGPRQLYESL